MMMGKMKSNGTRYTVVAYAQLKLQGSFCLFFAQGIIRRECISDGDNRPRVGLAMASENFPVMSFQ